MILWLFIRLWVSMLRLLRLLNRLWIRMMGELLCWFCVVCVWIFNFMVKFFFLCCWVRVLCWLLCYRVVINKVYFEFFCKSGLMLFVVGIYLYISGDLYLVKILYWIKMKMIEVDDEFYSYIVSYIKYIGESVFDILWCMLKFFVVL